jgi:type VI secretion system secreted protein VgrG
MSSYTQDNRLLSVSSVFGDDVLLLRSFTGREAISRLFSYQLELLSENDAIAAKELVGTSITWVVQGVDKAPRYFNGMVSRMSAGVMNARDLRSYRVEVVPKLWFLTRTANCRIYQNRSTKDIIKSVFREFGISDLQDDTTGSYSPREYCVQYRETSFNFVSRLMEDDGIFYFFHHDNGKHTLVLADARSAFRDCVENSVRVSGGTLAPNHITSWEHQYEYRSGRWTVTDYNFETPSTSLLASTNTILSLPNISSYEIFDYPGLYSRKADGTAEVKVRMAEEEAPYDVVVGTSECCTFTPGGKFRLEDHEIPSELGKYVITSTMHTATDTSYENTAQESTYSNSFTCIPDSVAYRPPRITPKPFVQGPQTAVVVGKSGEEIYVDKYGRVKVQFFWDRLGKKDENSSCWVRVAQHWAGKNWGTIFNPRIGQEVIVDFLEGDPDRPIITGRVYNAEQMPPYPLPDNMTQSGVKTRSTQGGSPANFNEIRFEDKKGSEQLLIHAEKDQSIEVEHDETHWVGNDRTKTIDHDETSHVKHDRTETVDHDETITVHNNRTETVDKDETITIHGSRTETVDGDETITISGNRTETVSMDETITINGGRTETVSQDETITIGGGRTETVSQDENVTVNGARTVTIGQGDLLSVGSTLVITATDSITFQTGQASITMQNNGDITISGRHINKVASGDIVGKACRNVTFRGQRISQN